MADSTHVYEEGKFKLYIDTTTKVIGHTEEGVELTFTKAKHEIFTHESGNVPIKVLHGGTDIHLKVKALEIDATNLAYAFPEATVSSGATTTISQDVGTDLSASPFNVVISDYAGTDRKWTFSNMIACPDEIQWLYRRGEKFGLDMVFRSMWMDTGTRATYTP